MSDYIGRVAELTAPHTFTLREVGFPAPPAGQVLVRVQRVGVCASDLPDWIGGPPAGHPPTRLGHEPVGVISAAGAGVVGLRTGQVVTGRLVPAFADYVYADPADLVVVPEPVDPAVAIGEPLGCVAEGYRRYQPGLGASVAVVGLGYMGLLMARLLVLSPIAAVWGVDPRPDAREAATGVGVIEALAPERAAGRSGSVELAVEASGTQAGLDLAVRLATEHGALSILGFHQGSRRRVDLAAWNWKALTVVNAHVRDQRRLAAATRDALALVASGRWAPGALLTHTYPLERINDAFQALRDKPPGFIKAVVTM